MVTRSVQEKRAIHPHGGMGSQHTHAGVSYQTLYIDLLNVVKLCKRYLNKDPLPTSFAPFDVVLEDRLWKYLGKIEV